MKLEPFDISVVQDRDIYILNYSEFYLEELYSFHPEILERIKGAFDDNEARHGEHEFHGHRIIVRDYEAAKEIPVGAVLIILSSYVKEPAQKFIEAGGDPKRFPTAYFFVDQEMKYDLHYRDMYSDSPLENIIIFRSSGAASHYVPALDFADNARALFEYLLSEGYNKRYKLVWLVHAPARYQELYASYDNVIFLSYLDSLAEEQEKRDTYYRYLCLAKYIFFCQSGVFVRNARKGQVRVQLWHGAGIKSHVPRLVEKERYEYMIVPSAEYARLHKDYFGLMDEQLLITGLPKDDLLFHPVEDWKERLSIPEAEKYILWLPTWRKAWFRTDTENKSGTGLPVVSCNEQMAELNAFLSERDIVLLIKLHPSQERGSISCSAMSHICLVENEDLIEANLQIDSILGNTVALISDYSSVAIGYTLLDRPIAFTLDDMEEYQRNRGFNWENILDWLPGSSILDFQGFLNFVENVADGVDESKEKRRRLNGIFHKYTDGNSAGRLVKRLGI